MGRDTKHLNFTGRVVPITNRPLQALQQTLDALNGMLPWEQVGGEEEFRAEELKQKKTPGLLREIVQLWKSSGPDLFKFSVANRELWKEIEDYWKKLPKLLLCASGGGAAIGWSSRPAPTPKEEAVRLFIDLMMNPECGRLDGACPRCGNYYIRRSVRNKVYCSRSCGTRMTALAATRKRREQEKARKLRRASQLSQQWLKARTRMGWKQWISLHEREITPKFLTRAVNSKELTAPTHGLKKEK